MTEPTYEPIEETENNGAPLKKKAKKIFGNTDLQKQALAATGRFLTGFTDNKQLKRFTDIEVFAGGMDDESRMWKAWMVYRIEQTVRLNARIVQVSMDELIRRFANPNDTNEQNENVRRQREIWFTDNRAKVLKPKTAQDVAGEIDPDMLARSNGTKS